MAPVLKYQGSGYRLTPEEKVFAEGNHNLIYKFLHQKGLPADEYYGEAATGYVIAVMEYRRRPELQKYRFSVIAYKKMHTSVWNEMVSRGRYQGHIGFSMDDRMENGEPRGDQIPDPADHFLLAGQREEMERLLGQILPVLTRLQREILLMKMEGFRMNEIMKRQKRSFVDLFRDDAVVKERVASVLDCSGAASGRGQGCTGATFPVATSQREI